MRSLRSSFVRSAHSLRCLRRASSSSRLPLRTPPRQHSNRTSRLPSLVGRVFGLPSVALVAPDSLARATRAQGALVGTRHHTVFTYK